MQYRELTYGGSDRKKKQWHQGDDDDVNVTSSVSARPDNIIIIIIKYALISRTLNMCVLDYVRRFSSANWIKR